MGKGNLSLQREHKTGYNFHENVLNNIGVSLDNREKELSSQQKSFTSGDKIPRFT